MEEKSASPKVDSFSSEGAVLDLESQEPHLKGWAKFVDGFKPAPIPDTTGMSEAEIKVIMAEHSPLKRRLQARHIAMIAIGGSIGSGLFIGSGTSFASGGPAGVLIAFGIAGVMIYCTMQALGELSVRYPVGGSFYVHSIRFVDPSWGFALGWNYAVQWMITYPLELIATAVALDYWHTDNNGATNVNKAAWVSLFYAATFAINIFGVRGYGEAEFIFSLMKVLAVVGFCIFGIVVAAGGGPDHHYYGAHYWYEPGAFANGAKGVFYATINAVFGFSGSEFAAIAAAETDNPAKNLPKAVRQVFWRILLFYIVSLTIVSMLVPYDEPRLGTASDGSASPFVLAISNAGVSGLPSVFNVVIVLAALSVGNSSVYGCTRTLAALAAEGHAPKILGYIDKEGRPLVAILITMAVGLLAFLVATPQYNEVFNWLLAFCSLSTLYAWGSACLAHVRYRMGMKHHNISLDEVSFQALGGVWVTGLGFVLNVAILGIQFWIALFPIGSPPNAKAFFEIYLSFPVVLIFYIGHKIWYKVPLYVKCKDMDMVSGTRSADLHDMHLEALREKEALKQRSVFYRTYKYWC